MLLALDSNLLVLVLEIKNAEAAASAFYAQRIIGQVSAYTVDYIP